MCAISNLCLWHCTFLQSFKEQFQFPEFYDKPKAHTSIFCILKVLIPDFKPWQFEWLSLNTLMDMTISKYLLKTGPEIVGQIHFVMPKLQRVGSKIWDFSFLRNVGIYSVKSEMVECRIWTLDMGWPSLEKDWNKPSWQPGFVCL